MLLVGFPLSSSCTCEDLQKVLQSSSLSAAGPAIQCFAHPASEFIQAPAASASLKAAAGTEGGNRQRADDDGDSDSDSKSSASSPVSSSFDFVAIHMDSLHPSVSDQCLSAVQWSESVIGLVSVPSTLQEGRLTSFIETIGYARYLGLADLVISFAAFDPTSEEHCGGSNQADTVEDGGVSRQQYSISHRVPSHHQADQQHLVDIVSLTHDLLLPPPAADAAGTVFMPGDSVGSFSPHNRSSSSSIMTNISINLPLHMPAKLSKALAERYMWAPGEDASYRLYTLLRQLLPRQVHVCLTVDEEDGHLAASPPQHVHRWIAESVRVVSLSSSVFIPNDDGYPVLPPWLNTFFRQLAGTVAPVRVMVRPPASSSAKKWTPNLEDCAAYVHFLSQTTGQDPPDFDSNVSAELEPLLSPFVDVLLTPLQPQREHLPASIYEVFERDPIKYVLYTDSVFQYLMSTLRPAVAPSSERAAAEDGASSKFPSERHIVVAGAGRSGPLIQCVLEAAKRASAASAGDAGDGPRTAAVRITALEKNPFALKALRLRFPPDKFSEVRIVGGTIRSYVESFLQSSSSSLEGRVDLVVSELLGSFGDNELAPECLSPFFFLPAPTVSAVHPPSMIPMEHTSYIAPVCCPKIWMQAMDRHQLEVPHVVRMRSAWLLARPRSLFRFSYSDPVDCLHAERAVTRVFEIMESGTMHGVAGFFDAKLYGNVHLSTKPAPSLPTSSAKKLISWFPMFFPFRTPVFLHAGTFLEIRFWRRRAADVAAEVGPAATRTSCGICSGSTWYEWACVAPHVSHIHNAGGQSHLIYI